jgi:uncharacterized membrane protein YhaH (DUF805 family)
MRGRAMDVGNLFFKFSGRINRAKFWIAVLVFAAIHLILATAIYATDGSAIVQSINGMLGIVTMISSLAVSTKRLHDRNKSGWYILVFYGPAIGLALISKVVGASLLVGPFIMLLLAAILIWMFVELGCLRGSIGGNAYGPDPIAPEVLTPPVRTH